MYMFCLFRIIRVFFEGVVKYLLKISFLIIERDIGVKGFKVIFGGLFIF